MKCLWQRYSGGQDGVEVIAAYDLRQSAMDERVVKRDPVRRTVGSVALKYLEGPAV